MLKIAVLVWIVLGATLAGSLVTVVVTVPSLMDQARRLIPVAAGIGFVAAVPLAWAIAGRIVAATHPRG